MLLKSSQVNEPIAVEMTPMIDMVFLLLIFFLVATTLRQEERELDIVLPVAESAAPVSVALREIVINVNQDGAAIINGKTMDAEAVRTLVADAVEINPKQKVTVRGDRRTPYDHIARILDACSAGGIEAPFLDTVPSN
ncbi:MAG: biopolymer transporter ExbD [Phycisphaerae bacterium]|nr:MAG: biopolymer transporter ExbD [Phycisphaerae bacterium]